MTDEMMNLQALLEKSSDAELLREMQVAFTEDEGAIQARLPDRPHPARGDRIGLRRSKGGAKLSNSKGLNPSVEQRTITVVADQEAWRRSVPTTPRSAARPTPPRDAG